MNTLEGFGAGFLTGAVGMFLIVLTVIVYIVMVLGFVKMFQKTGEPGWKALIPVYNYYILYKKCWKTSIFFIWLALEAVYFVLQNVADPDHIVVTLISAAIGIATIVIEAKRCGHIARAFGRGKGTAVGLFFLPMVFAWILGWGSAQYTAPAEE